MKLKNKIVGFLALIALGLGSLLVVSPSYAGGWGPNPFNEINHIYNRQMQFATFLVGAAAVTVVATALASAASHNNCRNVYYTHRCGYSHDGRRVCYTVRHVEGC